MHVVILPNNIPSLFHIHPENTMLTLCYRAARIVQTITDGGGAVVKTEQFDVHCDCELDIPAIIDACVDACTEPSQGLSQDEVRDVHQVVEAGFNGIFEILNANRDSAVEAISQRYAGIAEANMRAMFARMGWSVENPPQGLAVVGFSEKVPT